MSHVAGIECEVRDLGDLKVAAEALGFEFVEGQTTHKWFGRFLNDWRSERAAVHKGFDPDTFGRCEHALRLKDAQPTDYEVGVVRRGESWALVYDSFGQGRRLEERGGVDMLRLRNEVAAATATRVLERDGWSVRREEHGETIRIAARR
jgi:hypothetical protein